jgi:dipeptidyl aminopeptidase/acylaminoacyl peptidase
MFQDTISHILAFFALIIGIFTSQKTLNINRTPVVLNPLTIESMRLRTYPGSDIIIEETLTPAKTFSRYIASYKSDGLKIYALLMVPNGKKPVGGFPVIVLNHGYIIPEKYTPDGNYIAYANAFADAGYIVLKPSYRGHGNSMGDPTSTYFSPDYTIDDLNAISSIKKYPEANPDKIGVWGHSMGGSITLRDLVVNRTDIKAAAIWGGVVGNYNDIIYNWQNKVSYKPDPEDLILRNKNLDVLMSLYGTPAKNPTFWSSVDPTSYISDISVPVQISVGLSDNQVPPSFSKGLYDKFVSAGKNAQYFEYRGSNHDINQSFNIAMRRTISFFDDILKK